MSKKFSCFFYLPVVVGKFPAPLLLRKITAVGLFYHSVFYLKQSSWLASLCIACLLYVGLRLPFLKHGLLFCAELRRDDLLKTFVCFGFNVWNVVKHFKNSPPTGTAGGEGAKVWLWLTTVHDCKPFHQNSLIKLL